MAAHRSQARLLAALLALFAAVGSPVPASAGGFGNHRDAHGRGVEFFELGEKMSQAMAAGDLDAAEDYARRRLALANQIGPERRIGNAYRNLGSILHTRGKLKEAESVLRKAQPMIDENNGRLSFQAIRNMHLLIQVLIETARFAEAEKLSREMLDRQLAYAPHGIDVIDAYNSLGRIQRLLGRYDEARAWLDRADQADVSGQPMDINDNRAGPYWLGERRAHTTLERSRLAVAQDQFDRAEALTRKSLAAFLALEADAHPDVIKAKMQLGMILLREKKTEEAAATLSDTIPRAEKAMGRNNPEIAQAVFALAGARAEQGHAVEAEALYKRAIGMVQAEGAWDLYASFGHGYVRFLIARKRPKDALAQLRDVLDAIDRMYAQTRGLDESARSSFIAQFARYYYETISILLELNRRNPDEGLARETLAVVSRTESRVFTELLRQSDVGNFSANPEFRDLAARQARLNARLEELRRAYAIAFRENYNFDAGGERQDAAAGGAAATATDSNALVKNADPYIQSRIERAQENLDEERNAVQRELDEVEKSLWEKYPRYMELTRPRPVTVEELQQRILKPGETLVAYFLMPQETLAFVASRDEFHLVQMPVARPEIDAMVSALRKPEESVAGGFSGLAALNPADLNKLYAAIFKPVEPFLKPGQKLTIIADGPLYTLPFEMLVPRYGEAEQKSFEAARKTGAVKLAEYATLPYLGEAYRFSYLPSLSALSSMRLYRKPPVDYAQELVSFADPMFERPEAHSAAFDTLTRGLRRGGIEIPRLPETADEAREIADTVGGRSTLYLRDRAQEYTAKTIDLKETRYLHFATHGLLAGDFAALHDAMSAAEKDENSAATRNLGIAAVPDSGEPAPAPQKPAAAAGEPALLLSLSGDMHGEDGMLTMSEIIKSMDINAQLVVLSACNTAGEGEEAMSGEGFAGLTRAFMYAGAKGMLVSHWSVESRATQELMVETFKGLKQGLPALDAIDIAREKIRGSTAKIDGVLVSRSHPYFWSPFVYVGEAN